jgi:hypothetical protein
MEKNILRFNSYLSNLGESLNESTSVATISEIISAFVKVYMFLVSKSPDYKDVLADLIEINEEKDPAKRAQKMTAILDKVAGAVDPKYADAKSELKNVSSKISELFSSVASSDDAKEKKEVINKMIATKLLSYQDIVKKTATNESETSAGKNHILVFEQFSYPLLFEKNTFEDEREDLILQMKPTYTEMALQQKSPSTDNLKNKANEVIKRFDEITALLKNEDEWKKMKKKERKSKLEELGEEIATASVAVSELQKNELVKIGLEKKTAEDLATILSGISTMEKKAKEVDDAELAKAESGALLKSLKAGDIVRYKKDDGTEGEAKIRRIVADELRFTDKDGNEFRKNIKDIIGKSEKQEEEKKEEEKKEENKESFKLEKTIKATGSSPTSENLELSKKIFSLICDKFTDNKEISGMEEWKKSNFCKTSKFFIGPSRTAVIKAIKKEYGLDAENGDLTPELVAKLTA